MPAPTALVGLTATSPDVVASFVLADPVPVTERAASPAAVPVASKAALPVSHTLGGGGPRTVLLTAAAAVLAYAASAVAGSVAIPAPSPPGPVAVAASDGTGSSLDRYVAQLLFRRCHPDWSPVSSCPRPRQHRGRAAEEHARSGAGPRAVGDLPEQGTDG